MLFAKQYVYTLQKFLQFRTRFSTRNAIIGCSFLKICCHHSIFYAVTDHNVLEGRLYLFLWPSKPVRQTRIGVLRDAIMLNSSRDMWLVSRVWKLNLKSSLCNELEWTEVKEMGMVFELAMFYPPPLLPCPSFIFMRGAKVPAYLDPTPSIKLRSCPTSFLGGEESYFSYSYVLRNLSKKNVYMFLGKQRL